MQLSIGAVFKVTILAVLWFFYLPIALGTGIAKVIAGRWLLHNAVTCPTCGQKVTLLGLWECSACRFRFYGFYFSRCGCCGNVPTFINCESCEASILCPLI